MESIILSLGYGSQKELTVSCAEKIFALEQTSLWLLASVPQNAQKNRNRPPAASPTYFQLNPSDRGGSFAHSPWANPHWASNSRNFLELLGLLNQIKFGMNSDHLRALQLARFSLK